MPFRSAKQRAYLYANEPEVAKQFAKEHGNKIIKKRKGCFVKVKPRGFGRMLANKRPVTKVYV